LLHFVVINIAFGKTDDEHQEFPQLSKFLNFDDVKNRMSQLVLQIKKDDFREFKEIPFEGSSMIKKSNSYKYSVFLEYKQTPMQLFPTSISISKRQPPRGPFVTISFHPNSDVVSFYMEFMFEWTVRSQYDANGQLSSISLFDYTGTRNITFDKNEKIIKDSFLEHSDRIKQQIKKTKEELNTIVNDSSNILEYSIESEEYKIQNPEGIKNSEPLIKIDNIKSCCNAIIEGKTSQLIKKIITHRTEARINIYIFYSDHSIAFIALKDYSKNITYLFVFNNRVRLQRYLEGNIVFDMNMIGNEVEKTVSILPNSNGLEIKFHESGYPASYRNIVKGRLFGRQIEWNDKGEVISDIDLDIPKPWHDPSKKEEETTK
jgi:hypothetical protein